MMAIPTRPLPVAMYPTCTAHATQRRFSSGRKMIAESVPGAKIHLETEVMTKSVSPKLEH
jgi:hypothetical protein